MRSATASRYPNCTIKLWVETYAKTHSPGMMVGPVEGQFLKMLAT